MNCIPFWEPVWCDCLWFGLKHDPEKCKPFGPHPMQYENESETDESK